MSLVIDSLNQLFYLGFYFYLLRAKRNWSVFAAIAMVIGSNIFLICVYSRYVSSVAVLVALQGVAFLSSQIWIDVLIVRRALQGFPDARLVAIPALTYSLWQVTLLTCAMLNRLGWIRKSEVDLDFAWQNPFPVSVTNIILVLFLMAILAVLIRRFTRTSREQERLAGEVDAARTVQHVLIPEEIPNVPGFLIEAVYKPAG